MLSAPSKTTARMNSSTPASAVPQSTSSSAPANLIRARKGAGSEVDLPGDELLDVVAGFVIGVLHGRGLHEVGRRREQRPAHAAVHGDLRGVGGPVLAASSYFMKSPPVQYPDDEARDNVEKFIAGEIWLLYTSDAADEEDRV